MLLLAEGLFRLDVTLSRDTLRTVVRNLSSGEFEMKDRPSDERGANLALGEVEAYEPAQSGVEFALGSGDDRVTVKVLFATLHFADRGTVRVTAQAIVRQALQP